MSASTWSRDSHSLYDYENRDVLRQSLIVSSDCHLMRIGNDITAMQDHSPLAMDPPPQMLVRITKSSRGFSLSPCDGEPLWLVMKELEQEPLGFPLDGNSVVKIGRVRLAVREFEIEQTVPSTDNSSDEEEEGGKTCRICFTGAYPDDPLLSPCLCSGSMRFIHFNCLKYWLDSKRNVAQSEHTIAYFWESFLCEICKHAFPLSLSFKGRKYDLFKLEKPGQTTVALEMLGKDRQSRGVHLISMKPNSTVKFGRGHESDVRISDISVSRLHAQLSYDGSQFYLKDNSSKFGSLLQVAGSLDVNLGQTFVLQIGRTVITFSTNGPNYEAR
jgi:hypothetical protein